MEDQQHQKSPQESPAQLAGAFVGWLRQRGGDGLVFSDWNDDNTPRANLVVTAAGNPDLLRLVNENFQQEGARLGRSDYPRFNALTNTSMYWPVAKRRHLLTSQHFIWGLILATGPRADTRAEKFLGDFSLLQSNAHELGHHAQAHAGILKSRRKDFKNDEDLTYIEPGAEVSATLLVHAFARETGRNIDVAAEFPKLISWAEEVANDESDFPYTWCPITIKRLQEEWDWMSQLYVTDDIRDLARASDAFTRVAVTDYLTGQKTSPEDFRQVVIDAIDTPMPGPAPASSRYLRPSVQVAHRT